MNSTQSHKVKGFDEFEKELEKEDKWVEPDVSVEAIRPKFWKLRAPDALSAEGWENWTNNAKTAFPIRYWIQHDLLMWFSIRWTRIKDAIWWVRYRTTDRNHIIKLNDLEPGYYDTDTLILHSVFNLFVNFMKFQLSDKCFVDWESEHHIKEWNDMKEIYDWWLQRDTREERFEKENPYPTLPEEWGFFSVCNDHYRDESIMIEWKKVSKLHREQEEVWNQEDEDMLIRVIKRRRHLWN